VKQLGDILLEDGLVTQDQLAEAYDEHQRVGRALGRVLVDRGVLTESQLVAALAQQIGMRFVDLTDFPIDGAALASVTRSVAATTRCRSATRTAG
jgi:type IV pilus assembly protein PilB